MKRRQHRLITNALILADVASAALAFYLAFYLRFHSGWFAAATPLPGFADYATLLPFVVVLWPLTFSVQRLYRRTPDRSVLDEAFSIAVAAATATVVLFGVEAYQRLYYLRDVGAGQGFQYSRIFVGLYLALDIALTFAARTLVRRQVARARQRGFGQRRVLIAGAGTLGRRVASRMLAHPEFGLNLQGFLDDDPRKKGLRFQDLPVLGTSDDVLGIVRQERIDELVVALPWSAHDRMLQILEDTSREYLEVKIVPDLLEYIAFRAGLEDLDGLPLLNLGADPLHTWDWMLKRLFDVAAAALGLVALSPLLLLVALWVRRSSPGPILYAQERLGLDGRKFVMYKFRTMYADAEAETGPTFATDDDPRCTPPGRWLRRFWVDELPQLVNVLRGDMSIVGPRPERPSFVVEFKEKVPQYMLRHKMKSGLTGWAQVHGWRGNTSIPKRIEHDLYYVANWSLGLDLKIICMTVLRWFRRAPASPAV